MEVLREEAGRASGRAAIAARPRSIREEVFGEDGGVGIAERLGLPPRTRLDYGRGVTIPAQVMLQYLSLTGAEPRRIVAGDGAKYRRHTPRARPDAGRGLIGETSP